MENIKAFLKNRAEELGFELVGIAPPITPPGYSSFLEWLDKGYAGEMGYMARHSASRGHPESILRNVKSVVMVGLNYRQMGVGDRGLGHRGKKGSGTTSNERSQPTTPDPQSLTPNHYASYARGRDYHDVLHEKMNQLLDSLRAIEGSIEGRAVVDTAPLLERDYARLAGLGWFGKNTMLLNKRIGSFFFIGALLINVEIAPDEPFEAAHCGTCTACLDACPTEAFVEPGVLDSRKCISYLTIELRGAIPSELRPKMGEWIFGCDICQDVCPWNRKAPLGSEAAFGGEPLPGPEQLLQMSDESFRRTFKGTPMTRAKRTGLLRNAAIALGNSGGPEAIPVLMNATTDDDPIIQESAEWALERIRSRTES